MNNKQHTLRAFDKVLERLNKKVLKMFACSNLSLQLACKALFERDSDLANQVIADDDKIDELNKEINNEGMNILACFSPVSIDLRFILTLTTLSGRLERIGDYSTTIARHALQLNRVAETREVRLIEPVFQSILKHTCRIRKALEERDFGMIREDLQAEDNQENLTTALTDRLAKSSENESISIPTLAELIFISRSLEYIWTVLVNIEEDILGLA